MIELGFLFLWILVGVLAQVVDGALGMAYGVTSTSALISVGVYPVIASASVHTAEIFTTIASGASHFKFGNVRREIVLPLVMLGVPGGIAGAYLSTTVPVGPVKIVVASILVTLGVIILRKFVNRRHTHCRVYQPSNFLRALGFVAGFVDAIGGGGWGPIATTTLVANDCEPCKAVGSVNAAKFFITVSTTVSFIIFLGLGNFQWEIIFGLVIGGLLIAPFAGILTKKLPHKTLGILTGILIITLSTYTLLMASLGLL